MSVKSGNASNQLSRFFYRFHVLLYVIIVIGGLAGAIFSYYNIVVSSDEPANITSVQIDTSFDMPTIERLKAIQSQDGQSSPELDLPEGRISPF